MVEAEVEAIPTTTVPYKKLGQLTLYIDVYPPTVPSDGPVPALVYFHGGGMTVGDRTSWFPTWLYQRVAASGMAFISADYRLLPPSTGHDVLEDVVDLFAFLARTPLLGTVQVDGTRLAVGGCSAGGMCAFLAASHASPKPRAVLSLYGLGGEMFSPHLISSKSKPFFMGREILDPTPFSEFLFPASSSLAPTAQSPLTFTPARPPGKPSMPSNPRHQVARLWLQLGTYLDYWTGVHEPSISAALRELLPAQGEDMAAADARLAATLPPSEHALFPQLLVNSEWPPVMHLHGSEDTAVLAQSSRAMHARLLDAQVQTSLCIAQGSEHSFDLKRGAEERFGGLCISHRFRQPNLRSLNALPVVHTNSTVLADDLKGWRTISRSAIDRRAK
ncbi:alpha/beta-hydrolase [Russula earlei]|uniref:Alpha/beta-hydrolase n=1 Tax=Russula earlei TaxID=71964 RepID=A0ACC0UDY4_9AGAM|nr:alpha/beta-hydrolase [Russula earlei]